MEFMKSRVLGKVFSISAKVWVYSVVGVVIVLLAAAMGVAVSVVGVVIVLLAAAMGVAVSVVGVVVVLLAAAMGVAVSVVGVVVVLLAAAMGVAVSVVGVVVIIVRRRVCGTTGFRRPRALWLWRSERSEDATYRARGLLNPVVPRTFAV